MIIFFSDGGKVSRSSNQGLEWVSVTNGLPADFSVFYLTAERNTIFAAGWEKQINKVFSSSDFGENWINISEGLNLTTSYKAIMDLKNDEKYLYAATTDGIWRYDLSILVDLDDEETIVKEFSLSQNFPNPFNPSTSIEYRVASSEYIKLKVYDLLGREVAILVDEFKPAGSYEVEFDASNLSSGTYFYQLSAGEFISVKKLMLLK